MNRVLVLQFPKNARCNRCDTILEASSRNNIPIALVIQKRTWICIRCATRTIQSHNGKGSKYKLHQFITGKQINDFLKEHMQIEVLTK